MPHCHSASLSLSLSTHALELIAWLQDYVASLPTCQLLLLDIILEKYFLSVGSWEEEEGFLYRSTWSIKSGCQFSPLITRPNSENNDAASQHPLTADLLSLARSIIF